MDITSLLMLGSVILVTSSPELEEDSGSPAVVPVLLTGSVAVAFVVVRPVDNSPVGVGSGNSV